MGLVPRAIFFRSAGPEGSSLRGDAVQAGDDGRGVVWLARWAAGTWAQRRQRARSAQRPVSAAAQRRRPVSAAPPLACSRPAGRRPGRTAERARVALSPQCQRTIQHRPPRPPVVDQLAVAQPVQQVGVPLKGGEQGGAWDHVGGQRLRAASGQARAWMDGWVRGWVALKGWVRSRARACEAWEAWVAAAKRRCPAARRSPAGRAARPVLLAPPRLPASHLLKQRLEAGQGVDVSLHAPGAHRARIGPLAVPACGRGAVKLR